MSRTCQQDAHRDHTFMTGRFFNEGTADLRIPASNYTNSHIAGARSDINIHADTGPVTLPYPKLVWTPCREYTVIGQGFEKCRKISGRACDYILACGIAHYIGKECSDRRDFKDPSRSKRRCAVARCQHTIMLLRGRPNEHGC